MCVCLVVEGRLNTLIILKGPKVSQVLKHPLIPPLSLKMASRHTSVFHQHFNKGEGGEEDYRQDSRRSDRLS